MVSFWARKKSRLLAATDNVLTFLELIFQNLLPIKSEHSDSCVNLHLVNNTWNNYLSFGRPFAHTGFLSDATVGLVGDKFCTTCCYLKWSGNVFQVTCVVYFCNSFFVFALAQFKKRKVQISEQLVYWSQLIIYSSKLHRFGACWPKSQYNPLWICFHLFTSHWWVESQWHLLSRLSGCSLQRILPTRSAKPASFVDQESQNPEWDSLAYGRCPAVSLTHWLVVAACPAHCHSVLSCDAFIFFALTRLQTIPSYTSDDSNYILFCSISILFPGAVYSSIQLDRSDIFLQYNKGCRGGKKRSCRFENHVEKETLWPAQFKGWQNSSFNLHFGGSGQLERWKKKENRFWNVNETLRVNFPPFCKHAIESRCTAELLWQLHSQFRQYSNVFWIVVFFF